MSKEMNFAALSAIGSAYINVRSHMPFFEAQKQLADMGIIVTITEEPATGIPTGSTRVEKKGNETRICIADKGMWIEINVRGEEPVPAPAALSESNDIDHQAVIDRLLSEAQPQQGASPAPPESEETLHHHSYFVDGDSDEPVNCMNWQQALDAMRKGYIVFRSSHPTLMLWQEAAGFMSRDTAVPTFGIVTPLFEPEDFESNDWSVL